MRWMTVSEHTRPNSCKFRLLFIQTIMLILLVYYYRLYILWCMIGSEDTKKTQNWNNRKPKKHLKEDKHKGEQRQYSFSSSKLLITNLSTLRHEALLGESEWHWCLRGGSRWKNRKGCLAQKVAASSGPQVKSLQKFILLINIDLISFNTTLLWRTVNEIV